MIATASLRLAEEGEDETFVAFDVDDEHVLIHFPNAACGTGVKVPIDAFVDAMAGFVALLTQMPRSPVKLKGSTLAPPRRRL